MRHGALMEAGFIPGDLGAFTPVGNKLKLYDKGGGGSAAPTQQNVTSSNIPEYVRPYYETLLGQASALTDINKNPWQAYGGQRVAGFTPMQTDAFQNLQNMQLPGQTTDASNIAYNAANAGFGYQDYDPTTRRFTDAGVADQYMSPYIQEALDPVMDRMRRDADIRQRDLSSQAQQAGAFGGYRQGMQLAQEQYDTQKNMGDVYAQGLQNAYNAANQAFNTDEARLLQDRQFGEGLGLQGLATSLQGAGLLGNLGQQQYAQQLGLNQAQQMAGAQMQNLMQQNLTNQYQDFLNQQNWPYKNLSFLSEMIGRPMSNTTQSMYSAPPSTSQSLLGLGLGAYGLSGMFGNKSPFAKGGKVKAYANGGDVQGILSTLPPGEVNKLVAQGKWMPFSAQQKQANAQLATAAPMPPETTLPPMQGAGIEPLTAAWNPEPAYGMKEGGVVGYSGGTGSLVEETQRRDADEAASRRQMLWDTIMGGLKTGTKAVFTPPAALWDAAVVASHPTRELLFTLGATKENPNLTDYTALNRLWPGLNEETSDGKPTPAKKIRGVPAEPDAPHTAYPIGPNVAAGEGIASVTPTAKRKGTGTSTAKAPQQFRDNWDAETQGITSTPAPAPTLADLLSNFTEARNKLSADNPASHALDATSGNILETLQGRGKDRAFIDAAAAVMGGRGGKTFLHSLADAAVGGGKRAIADADALSNAGIVVAKMRTAIAENDGKMVADLSKQLSDLGMKREEIAALIQRTKMEIGGRLAATDLAGRYDLQKAGILAAARQRDPEMESTKMLSVLIPKMGSETQKLYQQMMKDRSTTVEYKTGTPEYRGRIERLAWEDATKQTTPKYGLTLTRLLERAGWDTADLPALLRASVDDTAATTNRVSSRVSGAE